MPKMTIEDAALHFGVSKEAIHNRIRRGSLESFMEDGVKLVEIGAVSSRTATKKSPRGTQANSDDKYYTFLEEQNAKLQEKVEKLEGETRSLRDQKEQMLIQERIKIEEIYQQKDEQLKNILNAISSKFMLNAPIEVEDDVSHVEAEIENQEIGESEENGLISLKKYLKEYGFSKTAKEKIKNKFKKIAKKENRVIIIGKKYYIDFNRYDYSDIFSS